MARRVISDEERAQWDEATRGTAARVRTPRAAAPPPPEKPAPPPAAPPPPAVKKSPGGPLAVLGRREAARRFKPHARIEATLDLHGMTQAQAHAALERFLRRAHAAGKRHLAIITGKGRGGEGALKRAVPHWLEAPELRGRIASIAHAAPEKGGEGVLHVLLKKPS